MNPMPPGPPAADEAGPHMERYTRLVPEADLAPVLEEQLAALSGLLSGLDDATARSRHAPFSWSIKQVLGHLTDTERVFAYRALSFARGDSTPLPGFDENAYVANADFDAIPLPDLLAEWTLARRSHVLFLRNLRSEDWGRQGIANGRLVTVRALAYAIAGHTRHHESIVRRRLKAG